MPDDDYFQKVRRAFAQRPDAVGMGGYLLEGVTWQRSGRNGGGSLSTFRWNGWERREDYRWRLRRIFGLSDPDTAPGLMPPSGHGRPIGFLPPDGKVYEVEAPDRSCLQLETGASGFLQVLELFRGIWTVRGPRVLYSGPCDGAAAPRHGRSGAARARSQLPALSFFLWCPGRPQRMARVAAEMAPAPGRCSREVVAYYGPSRRVPIRRCASIRQTHPLSERRCRSGVWRCFARLQPADFA